MVSQRSQRQSTEKVLLVEGRNDEQVILHVCDKHSSFSVEGGENDYYVNLNTSSSPSFSVLVKGNDSELLKSIHLEFSPAAGRQVVGIVMDADNDVQVRWDNLKEWISQHGIKLPDHPNDNGTIIDTIYMPRVGIWIMPDNNKEGELEHFVQQMLPANDPVWPLAQGYIDGIPKEHRKFADHKIVKAQFYAWLATRRQPGLMGAAVGADDLEIDGALCQKFVAWLEELFG